MLEIGDIVKSDTKYYVVVGCKSRTEWDYITYFLNLPENTEKDAILDISYLCQPVTSSNQEAILSKPITYYVELTEKRNNIEKIGKIDEKVYSNYLIKSHLQNGVTISNVVTYQEIVDDIHISYLAVKDVKVARKLAKEKWKYGNLYFLNGVCNIPIGYYKNTEQDKCMVFLEFDSHSNYTTMITMLHIKVVAVLFQRKLYNDTMKLDNVHFNIVSESDLKDVVKTTIHLTPEQIMPHVRSLIINNDFLPRLKTDYLGVNTIVRNR